MSGTLTTAAAQMGPADFNARTGQDFTTAAALRTRESRLTRRAASRVFAYLGSRRESADMAVPESKIAATDRLRREVSAG